ncbi:porin family protein [Shewanella decolorationis]|uniref:Porin family protein n=2 Tax=Shewanella decolorationis TaxID=256839 RepID=A0A5B8QTJ0_9GAMM|nr:porin family protein [Shewanella decolorationis]ESE39385.1 OmpA-like transmembrane domain-containing protein [Shewanella decolorationis S12]QDZ89960.1 porin family protein [Shewanella decolorationis]GLR33319.1 membrane protein [Shewanella decolorationis]
MKYLTINTWLLSFALLAGSVVGKAHAGDSPHLLGGSLGYGTQEFETKSGKYDAGDTFTSDLYYRYMLNEHWGLEAGYLAGSGGVVSALVSAISDIKDLSYQGVRTTVYGEYALSRGNSLYAKLGAAYTKVSYEMDKQEMDSDDVGFYGAVGWQYRFRSGFGLNLEYQYVPMKELELQGVNFGMSYRF